MRLRAGHYAGALIVGVLLQAGILASLAYLSETPEQPLPVSVARTEVSFEVAPIEPDPLVPTDETRDDRAEADEQPLPPRAEFRAPPLPSAFQNPTAMSRLRLVKTVPGRRGEGSSGQATSEEVRDAAEVERPPKILEQQLPRYPSELETEQIEGMVVLRILVDPEGAVSRIEVLASEPPGVFDEAAISAARTWQFEPARHLGKHVPVWVRQKLKFSLP